MEVFVDMVRLLFGLEENEEMGFIDDEVFESMLLILVFLDVEGIEWRILELG